MDVIFLPTVAIWLGGLILLALGHHGALTPPLKAISIYWSVSESSFENGELFLVATGMLGPIIYEAARLRIRDEREGMKEEPSFPSALWFVVASLIAALVCAAFFALGRANVGLDKLFVLRTSEATALAVAGLLYLSLVYKRFSVEDAVAITRKSTQTLQQELSLKRKRDE